MRTHRRADRVTNRAFLPTDPRRHEPGKQSVKRIGARWRERWHAQLGIKIEKWLQQLQRGDPMIENAEQARALREPARGSLEDVLRDISQSARQHNHTMERTLREGVADELRARGFEVKEMGGGVFIKW